MCGDIHGQYYDLMNIFKLNGLPSEDNPYVSLYLYLDIVYHNVNIVVCIEFVFKE